MADLLEQHDMLRVLAINDDRRTLISIRDSMQDALTRLAPLARRDCEILDGQHSYRAWTHVSNAVAILNEALDSL